MKISAAALLALRMLLVRPRRTLILLLGYGLGVAVMIALLAVGDALLLQARDRDVVAGGDLVLVPAGIDAEVLKTGAATAMFLVMPNARFLTRQVLMGPRYADTIAAASPEMIDKLIYVRVRDRVTAARASGAIPSAAAATRSLLEVADARWQDDDRDRAWITPSSQERLDAIDRFHTPPAGPEGRTWAEWWYFNFATNDGTHGYVSFIADRERRVRVAVTLHRPGERVLRLVRHTSRIGFALRARGHRRRAASCRTSRRHLPDQPTPDGRTQRAAVRRSRGHTRARMVLAAG